MISKITSFVFSGTIILYPNENLGFVFPSNESEPNSQNKLREAAENIAKNLMEN